jgi:hypothetical protein
VALDSPHQLDEHLSERGPSGDQLVHAVLRGDQLVEPDGPLVRQAQANLGRDGCRRVVENLPVAGVPVAWRRVGHAEGAEHVAVDGHRRLEAGLGAVGPRRRVHLAAQELLQQREPEVLVGVVSGRIGAVHVMVKLVPSVETLIMEQIPSTDLRFSSADARHRLRHLRTARSAGARRRSGPLPEALEAASRTVA